MEPLPEGVPLRLLRLEPSPDRILIEYEGPRLFVSRVDDFGLDVLAFCCDEDDDAARYIVVPTTLLIIDALEDGAISVRDALTRTTSRPWILDVDGSAVCRATALEGFGAIEHYLPKPHLMLHADLQPLLTLRMEGPELVRGSTPRDAVLHAFKSVPEALKRLLDYVLERDGRVGRPHEQVRALYGLSAQRFAFSSFEVAFRHPPREMLGDVEARETLRELSQLVEKSIKIASGAPVHASDEERRVLFEAARKMAPPSRGIIHSVSFGGSMVGREARGISLTRKTRARVKALQDDLEYPDRGPRVLGVEGRVGDIDFDVPSLELRDLKRPGRPEKMVIGFDADVLDDVMTFAAEGARVRAIVERNIGGTFGLLAIYEVSTDDESSW